MCVDANVDRTDYRLVIHSAKLNATTLSNYSLIPEYQETVVPLHLAGHSEEAHLGPNSLIAYYWSPKDLPLDFAKDKEVTLALDISLHRGNEVVRRTFQMTVEASVHEKDHRGWLFHWGLWW